MVKRAHANASAHRARSQRHRQEEQEAEEGISGPDVIMNLKEASSPKGSRHQNQDMAECQHMCSKPIVVDAPLAVSEMSRAARATNRARWKGCDTHDGSLNDTMKVKPACCRLDPS